MLKIQFAGPQAQQQSPHHALSDIVVEAGKRVGIIGGCNSGKTHLCLALVGLSSGQANEICIQLGTQQLAELSSRDLATRTALIPSNVRTLFSGVFETVIDELNFSFSLLGNESSDKGNSVDSIIDELALRPLSQRDPFSLSGGEKVRVALALQLIKNPSLIVLDQSFDQLDHDNKDLLLRILKSRCNKGSIVIEAHATKDAMFGEYDAIYSLDASPCNLRPWMDGGSAEVQSNVPASNPQLETLLRIGNLEFSYGGDAFVLGPISFQVHSGDSLAVVGANGSGKTTLLKSLGLLFDASFDEYWVLDRNNTRQSPPKKKLRHVWSRSVQYAFQDPTDQLFRSTVAEELHENAVRGGGLFSSVQAKAYHVADQLGLRSLMQTNPLALPRPLQRSVTIGAILVASPPIILLDEPTAELDECQKENLFVAIHEYLSGGGACIIVSHDKEFTRRACNRRLTMDNGKLLL